MSVLIFSDMHAHAWGEFSSLIKYRGQLLNSRLVDAAKVIDWVGRCCEERSITEVIFGGDLFHRKRMIDVPVFNVVAAALWRLAKKVKQVTLMAGNHDLTRRSAEGNFSDEHALYALGGHPRITVIDRPVVVCGGLGLVPYGSDRDTILAGVETCIKAGARALMMHAGVAGAVTGPVEFQPYEPVTVDDLPGDMVIYSGHYHMPQCVQNRVTYIGAPLELVRGDGKGQRGAVVIGGDDFSAMERLSYRKGPRFLTRHANDLKHIEQVAGNFVDLHIACAGGESEKAIQILQEAGARAVHPVFVAAPAAVTARMPVKVTPGSLPTVEKLCRQLIKQADDTLDSRVLWQLAQEALHDADSDDEIPNRRQ
jgi:DNA repair exonuclease SbcCD nuclease subunit